MCLRTASFPDVLGAFVGAAVSKGGGGTTKCWNSFMWDKDVPLGWAFVKWEPMVPLACYMLPWHSLSCKADCGVSLDTDGIASLLLLAFSTASDLATTELVEGSFSAEVVTELVTGKIVSIHFSWSSCFSSFIPLPNFKHASCQHYVVKELGYPCVQHWYQNTKFSIFCVVSLRLSQNFRTTQVLCKCHITQKLKPVFSH